MKDKHIHIEVKSGNAKLSDKQEKFKSKNKNHYRVEREDTFWWY
jgi:hypothetical protein